MAESFTAADFFRSLRPLITGTFWLMLLCGAGLFVLRLILDWPIFPLQPNLLFQLALFELGIAIGFFLISSHHIWLRLILSFLPGMPEEDTSAVDTLRSPVMFIILPVVIFLLALTPTSWIGLGALWAFSSWYGLEALNLLQNKPDVISVYFPRLQAVQQDAVYHLALWIYLVIWAGFTCIIALR